MTVSVTGSGCCRAHARGLERHQTLRHAVGWSYDLLEDDERSVLDRCSVFADGFDLAAATHVNDGLDDYHVLDVLDSLVRKSLVTVDPVGGHARYGMLETIRQFAEDQLAATGSIERGPGSSRRATTPREAVVHWEPVGRARQRRGAGLGRRRARQPARRVPLGDRPGRSGDRRGDRCAHHHDRLGAAALRAGRLGRGDPPRRHHRRPGAATPPLHRRQPVPVHRSARGRPRLRPDRPSRWKPIPATTPSRTAWSHYLGGVLLTSSPADSTRR